MFALLFTLLFTQNVWAFKIVLMDDTLKLDNGVVSTTATVVNDSTSMIAMEAGVRVRSYSQDGVENNDKIAQELIIIPSQMIISAGAEQVLNIRWVGPPSIASEQAYRLLIEYVSVSEDKLKGLAPDEQQAMLNINYRVAKSFYVAPKGAKPQLQLQNAQKITKDGKDMLRLSFDNIGNQHQVVGALDVRFPIEGGGHIDVSLKKEDFGNIINFLAHEKRDIDIVLPPSLQDKNFQQPTIRGFGE